MKKVLTLSATLILIMISSFTTDAQVEKFKALYIYNICRFVEWPDGYGNSTFTIGIIGTNSALTSNLETLLGSKNINGKSIKIINVGNSAEANNCNVLYFIKGKEKQISEIGKGAKMGLIISENSGATSLGSGINFFLQDSKLKFELKQDNITTKGLNMSSQLISLATKTL